MTKNNDNINVLNLKRKGDNNDPKKKKKTIAIRKNYEVEFQDNLILKDKIDK